MPPNLDPLVNCRWVRGLRRTPENLNWYGLGTDLLGIAEDIGAFIPVVGGPLWFATEILEAGSAAQDAAEMIGYIKEGKILEPQALYSAGRMFMDIFSLAPEAGSFWNLVDGMVELTVNGFEGVDIYVCDRGKNEQ